MRNYTAPLLITGSPRSGTSALAATLLRMSPAVAISHEWGSFLARPCDRMRRLCDVAPEFFVNHPLRATSCGATGFMEYLRQTSRTPQQIHTTAYGSSTVYGDKFPSSYLAQGMQTLLDYPSARFIVTLRDGRDVIASQLRTNKAVAAASRAHWAQHDSVSRAQELWLQCMRSWETLKPQLTSDQYMELRYEEAVADPLVKLHEVAVFAGISVDDAELKIAVRGYKPTHVGAWRTEQPDIMLELGAPFREMLQKWNYL